MPVKAKELSAKEVRDLTVIGLHPVGGVAGLRLQITSERGKSWIYRVKVGGKRREIGLGGFPDVSLAEARERARELKEKINGGFDPVAEKKEARLKLIQEQNRFATFEQIARDAFQVKEQEFKNAKHASQWIATLENYAFPIIGNMPVAEIQAADVKKVLDPIWTTKTETASRVRQRMAAVFDYALANHKRFTANPAAWKGCLQPLLPSPEKLKKKLGKSNKHHPALPVNEMPRFIRELRSRKGDGARALEFAILTAARTGEVMGARWDEISLTEKVWRLTAERMKADKPHTVTLSDNVISLLEVMPNRTGLIFQTPKGGELSSAAMLAVTKRLHHDDIEKGGKGFLDPIMDKIATPHGFRSTFKDWTRQKARFPDEWSELALAHVNSDETRSAYARNELLEERAGMMQAWDQFCAGGFSDDGKVVSMGGRG